jgi:sec-independent protein translocase protein TatC
MKHQSSIPTAISKSRQHKISNDQARKFLQDLYGSSKQKEPQVSVSTKQNPSAVDQKLSQSSKQPVTEQSQTITTFYDHLIELRKRLFWCAVVVGIGSIIGYYFNQKIISFLARPLNQPLYYTSPAGGFNAVFQISLMFGILLSTPFLVYQLVKFIEPAISKQSRNFVLISSFSSFGLMLLGVMFAYFVSLPAALSFLSKFGSGEIKSLISTKDYFNFILIYIGGFGLLFQLPLVILSANWAHKIKARKLLKYIRYVILISFIAAAIITPTPDPFNQTIMALPIILLYLISVVLVWIVNIKTKK